jgi:hypothetical protein
MSAQIPTRGQRQRTKGWTAPENSLYVGRPSQWGNPWRVKENGRNNFSVHHEPQGERPRGAVAHYDSAEAAAAHAVQAYREHLEAQSDLWIYGRLQPLLGKVLLCWCNPTLPCHVDVLIECAAAHLEDGRQGTYQFKTWQPRLLTGKR